MNSKQRHGNLKEAASLRYWDKALAISVKNWKST